MLKNTRRDFITSPDFGGGQSNSTSIVGDAAVVSRDGLSRFGLRRQNLANKEHTGAPLLSDAKTRPCKVESKPASMSPVD